MKIDFHKTEELSGLCTFLNGSLMTWRRAEPRPAIAQRGSTLPRLRPGATSIEYLGFTLPMWPGDKVTVYDAFKDAALEIILDN